MMDLLIISTEPALEEFFRAAFGAELELQRVDDWECGQRLLYLERYDVVCLDYEVLKFEDLNTFIAIDNIFEKESTWGVLAVKSLSERARQLKDKFGSIGTIIETDQGRESIEALLKVVKADCQDLIANRERSRTERFLTLEQDLPSLESGDLEDVHLARLLYTIAIRKADGELTLRSLAHQEVFSFSSGRLVDPELKQNVLESSFAWKQGTFSFERKNHSSPQGQTPLIPIILSGIRNHMEQRHSFESMMTQMQAFPSVTNLWEERRDRLVDFATLHATLRLCDGQSSWETVFSGLGAALNEGFRAAYFAIQTDLAITREKPGSHAVFLRYSKAIRQDRIRTDEARQQASKAFRATGSGRPALEKELSSLAESQNQALRNSGNAPEGLYEVFGVWAGCGKDVVQERFYQVVKDYHPDVFGGNVSERIKELAEEVFILYRKIFQQLSGLETEQTVLPPDPDKSLNSGEAGGAEDKSTVRSRIESLSGYHRRTGATQAVLTTLSEELSSAASTAKPEVRTEEGSAEREAKIKRLRRNSSVPRGLPKPTTDLSDAQVYFNEGFRAFRNHETTIAYNEFAKAFENEPSNGLYLTFYGYTRFLTHPDRILECEKFLRRAIESQHRQALPDAHLFLGHILKERGETEGAQTHYEQALALNPKCIEAERELRLTEKREQRQSNPGRFIRNFFKKT
jgi:tetratricopeptide (TPR) repeat protein